MHSAFAIDTSVAIPMALEDHDDHQRVRSWAADKQLRLCGHALMETYATLTRAPGEGHLTPDEVSTLINRLFSPPVVLPDHRFALAYHELKFAGITGESAYDGLVGLTARYHGLTLATCNAKAKPIYEAIGVDIAFIE